MSKELQEDASPKMKRKDYEKELRKLQTELCLLQDWVKHRGLRVIVVFEGRDAAGKGGLEEAITLTGGRARVITLADERARDLGVAFSSYTPDGAPDAIDIGMELLANGELQLRSQRSLPMSEAAEAHRLLEEEGVREKLLLTTVGVG